MLRRRVEAKSALNDASVVHLKERHILKLAARSEEIRRRVVNIAHLPPEFAEAIPWNQQED